MMDSLISAAYTENTRASKHIGPVICFLMILLLSSCGGKTRGTEKVGPGEQPILAVSILPQAYFANRIAGDRVRVMTLAGPGQNPHNYEPTPKQMADLAAAGAWVLSGTEFEISLRPKVESLFPALLMVDGTRGVRFRTLEAHDDEDEADLVGEDGVHIDRHTWLGQEPARILAGHIRDACIALDAAGKAVYQNNYGTLIEDIDREFDSLRQDLAALRGKTVFVYHPAFGYFLDEFGIVQAAVETGGREPTPRILNALIGQAKQEQVAVIFVQAQFPVYSARTVAAAAGAALVPLDPLAPDWLANIRTMGEALKDATKQEYPGRDEK
jgi:zinc transport system substrate-binding protein